MPTQHNNYEAKQTNIKMNITTIYADKEINIYIPFWYPVKCTTNCILIYWICYLQVQVNAFIFRDKYPKN